MVICISCYSADRQKVHTSGHQSNCSLPLTGGGVLGGAVVGAANYQGHSKKKTPIIAATSIMVHRSKRKTKKREEPTVVVWGNQKSDKIAIPPFVSLLSNPYQKEKGKEKQRNFHLRIA